MTVTVYLKKAYRDDEDPEVVFVVELDGTDNNLAALRVRGKWEDAPEMTVHDLESRYRVIDDPAEVDRLIAEARASLGVSPKSGKGFVIVGARPSNRR
jgi:hypothetical protein